MNKVCPKIVKCIKKPFRSKCLINTVEVHTFAETQNHHPKSIVSGLSHITDDNLILVYFCSTYIHIHVNTHKKIQVATINGTLKTASYKNLSHAKLA